MLKKRLVPMAIAALDAFCLYRATFGAVYETSTAVVLPIAVQPLLLINLVGFVLVMVLADW